MAGSIPNRRIFTQDVLDADGAIDPERLLYVMNTFMESVFVLFEQGIELGPHVNADIRVLEFQTPSDYVASNNFNDVDFSINIKGKRPVGVILGRIQDVDDLDKNFTDAVTITWREVKNQIRVSYITGLEDDKTYRILLLVI